MEQIYFGERIASYRKALGLTQEGLAQKIGVTNQAVSKWEADQCCPDIMLLPVLADVFGVTLDELFGRPASVPVPQGSYAAVDGLPWPDDEDLRAVCYYGHKLVDYDSIPEDKPKNVAEWLERHVHVSINGASYDYHPAELHFSGRVRDIHSDYAVICENTDVAGDVNAGDSVRCGNVGGSVTAGDGVTCGEVTGDVNAGDGVTCGNIGGSAEAGDSIYCGNIGGDASAGDSIHCGIIGGNADAGDSIYRMS